MASVHVAKAGDCAARWAPHIDRVVIDCGDGSPVMVNLTVAEAWSLAAELIAAAHEAACSSPAVASRAVSSPSASSSAVSSAA